MAAKPAAALPGAGEAGSTPSSASQAAISPTFSFEEIEQRYLHGQITAREFQRYIELAVTREESKSAAKPPTENPAAKAVHDKALTVLRESNPDPGNNPKPGPVLKPADLPLIHRDEPAEEPDPADEGFAEIEKNLDELIRLKSQRDQISRSNRVTEATQKLADGKSKREKLDALLRLFVEGEINEAEYQARRAEIIAAPE